MANLIKLSVLVVIIELAVGTGAAAAESSRAAKNKEIVTSFYNLAFRDHKIEEAFARYGGRKYIQHNPLIPDGKEVVIKFFNGYFKAHPQAINEIKRAIAEGDLVVLHVLSKKEPSDRGRAMVDIFRVENGKIIEHWDVIQDIPEKAANPHTMF
jgi:predicted SnoaL-like aldol condensation-catalyzing enzyme